MRGHLVGALELLAPRGLALSPGEMDVQLCTTSMTLDFQERCC